MTQKYIFGTNLVKIGSVVRTLLLDTDIQTFSENHFFGLREPQNVYMCRKLKYIFCTITIGTLPYTKVNARRNKTSATLKEPVSDKRMSCERAGHVHSVLLALFILDRET